MGAGLPAAFSIAAAYENAHDQPRDPNVAEDWRWTGVLLHIAIAIALGFLLGFAFALAICAWRESSGTERKTETAASDLECGFRPTNREESKRPSS